MRVELQRQYVAQGRYDASVEAEVVEQARNRVSVNINISEGEVAAIKRINIVGNTLFDEDDLKEPFELKSTGWLSWITSDDKYSKEKLNGDLETKYKKNKRPFCPGPEAAYRQLPATLPSDRPERTLNSADIV